MEQGTKCGEKRQQARPFYIPVGGKLMYVSPRITDFGRIELHTYAFPGSGEDPATEPEAGGGGGGAGIGLVGLIGGALVLAGRGSDDESAAVIPPEEESEKQAQK